MIVPLTQQSGRPSVRQSIQAAQDELRVLTQYVIEHPSNLELLRVQLMASRVLSELDQAQQTIDAVIRGNQTVMLRL